MTNHRPQSFVTRCLTRSLTFAVLTLLFALCALPLAASAQTSTATLSGTVVDANNAVVPGATITVTEPATGLQRTATTNDQGSFTIPLLKPSSYILHIEHAGFLTAEVRDLVLNVNDERALTIKMKVGDVKETVNITGEEPLINESPAVGTVVDRQFVENIPLNGRSFQSLIALTPGIVPVKIGSLSAVSPGQFSTNGQRSYGNNFIVDGVSANAGGLGTAAASLNGLAGQQPALTALGTTQGLVSVDALQEFRIQTSNYAPEFGRGPGAQIELVTRSGTNQFHGSLYEYFRNDVFDANDWFANSVGRAKSPLRQNDFGGTIGGPVLLPRFGEGGHQPGYNGRNRTFFFISYEGLRLRLPQTAVLQVPSLSLRQQAPAVLQPFLNAFPLPTGAELLNAGQPTGASPFLDSHSDPSSIDAFSVRVDHNFGERFTLFGTLADTPSHTVTRALTKLTTSPVNTRHATVGGTIRISPTITNELRFGYSHVEGGSSQTLDNFGGAIVPSDRLYFPAPSLRKDSQFGYNFNFITGASLTQGLSAATRQRQINLVDSFSITSGGHSLKFGVDYRRSAPIITQNRYSITLNFLTRAAALAGTVSAAPRSVNVFDAEPVFSNWSLYGQDAWRVSSRLTLTYGLRWDVNPAPRNSTGVNPPTLTNTGDPAHFGATPLDSDLYSTPLKNFAPRVGAVFRLRGNTGWQTVVRGGFGYFYDLGSSSTAVVFTGAPFTASATTANVPFPLTPAQLAPPVPSTAPPYNSTLSAFPDFKLPYTVQWNVATEQELGANQALTLSYVGNFGRHYLRANSWSAISPISTGSQTVFFGDATSDYDALQAQFQRRLSHGLQVLASYTWSHAIDDISVDQLGFNQPARANSDFDTRHSFSTAVSYDIPVWRTNRATRAILGGWGVDAKIQAFTGTPVTLSAGNNTTGTGGLVSIRPDLVSGVPLYLDDPTVPGGRRFNPAAFVAPPKVGSLFTRQGTLNRNVLRTLGANQLDLSIRRQFPLTERLKLQFRAEAFNLFNHPNFGLVGTNTTTPTTLGVPSQMLGRSLGGLSPLYQIGGPRSLQFSLRLTF